MKTTSLLKTSLEKTVQDLGSPGKISSIFHTLIVILRRSPRSKKVCEIIGIDPEYFLKDYNEEADEIRKTRKMALPSITKRQDGVLKLKKKGGIEYLKALKASNLLESPLSPEMKGELKIDLNRESKSSKNLTEDDLLFLFRLEQRQEQLLTFARVV